MLVVELFPAGQMSTLVIFNGDWSLYMKLLRNFGYSKMYTGLWDRDWTNVVVVFYSQLDQLLIKERRDVCIRAYIMYLFWITQVALYVFLQD